MLAALALVFDLTSVLALMYPGRERVEITGSDGVTYVYACKSGPDGETPGAQGAKAMAAFEENVTKFVEVLVGETMAHVADGEPSLGTALALSRKTDSWAAAINAHLEREYGCALLG